MSLQSLPIPYLYTATPRRVARLFDRAPVYLDALEERHWKDPIAGFFPSDFRMVHAALAGIVSDRLVEGRLFCEWGSGLGAVACLADLLGFEASGLEVEARLVSAARELADELDCRVQFVCGSFIPTGLRFKTTSPLGDVAWLDLDAPAGYSELGLEIGDLALVFAYPWPGEADRIFELFDRFAEPGALLLTFHGAEDLRLHRKLPGRTNGRANW